MTDETPDLDQLTRAQLGELDPVYDKLAQVLDDWNVRLHGIFSGAHGIGLFLELLAAEGYRVEPITAPALDEVLPAPDLVQSITGPFTGTSVQARDITGGVRL